MSEKQPKFKSLLSRSNPDLLHKCYNMLCLLQEALYELVRLQSDLEERHATEIEQKNINIAELTDMVEELAARLGDFEVSKDHLQWGRLFG